MNWKELLTEKRFVKIRSFKGETAFEKYKTSAFVKDYQTIINSAAFRRLQDKTQVFPLDISDFVRTRLTHSIETSSIAKQLGNMILDNMKYELKRNEMEQFYPLLDCAKDYKECKEINNIPEILSCAGLLHDIGNPPFGHFGETVMAGWFKENLPHIKYKGQNVIELFSQQQIQDLYHLEGNAQAIRVITKLHFIDNDYGMNLTKSLINVLVKYPVSSIEIDGNSDNVSLHKLGFYECDQKIMDDITQITGTKINNKYVRHPLTFLLEAADDIAYATADLEDGFKKGFFTLEEFIELYKKMLDETDKNELTKPFLMIKELEELILESQKENHNEKLVKLQIWLNEVRQWLMYNAAYSFMYNYRSIMNGTYYKELMDGNNVFHSKTLKILKKISYELIFKDTRITKIEISGSVILSFLLDKFIGAIIHYDIDNENYPLTKEDIKLIGLLPDNYIENYKMEKTEYKNEIDYLYLRIHLVVDYISGMTDSYARRLYQELHGGY